MFSRATVISLSVLSLFGLVFSFTSDELRVTLSNGSKLVGRYLRSHNGRPIKSFNGIPYAKPPVDNLRFKVSYKSNESKIKMQFNFHWFGSQAPEPMDKWDGEFEAINDGPICSQRNPFVRSEDDLGSEDCLYLNVHVPHRVTLPPLIQIRVQ